MRRLVLFGAALAACGGDNTTVDPCAGVTDLCIAARVEGAVTGLDQLVFSIDSPTHKTTATPSSPTAFSLPVKVGLVLPANVTSPLTISLQGISNMVVIAADQESVAFSANRGSVTFTLRTSTLPDLSAVQDMATQPDLEKPNPTLTPSPAAPVGRELEPISFTVTGADALNLSPNTVLTGLPTGATSTNGAVATFNWTPDFTAAGIVNLTATVTTSDSRMATLPIMLTVLNSLDPVPPLNPNDIVSTALPANAIGDFDGDGKGDVASCTVVGNNYIVTVLYGDAKGLPVAPPPAAQLKTYMFPATTATTTPDNTRLPCLGADMDGDGLSDVIVQDALANGTSGQVYIFYGTARANNSSSAATVLANPFADGEALKNPIFVGHYQANGKADLATMTFPTSGTNADIVNIIKGRTSRPGGGQWDPPEQHALTPAQEVCTRRAIIGFGDFDKDGLDDLLVWDKNVGSTAPCNTAATAKGGFTLFSSSMPDKSWVRPPDPASAANFGLPPTSTFCDVDGDGAADLIVSTDATQSDPNAKVFFAPFALLPSPSPAPLDPAQAALVMAMPAGHIYSEAHCVPKFFGSSPASLLLIDVGDASNPARADVITTSVTPTVMRSLPSPDLNDKKYGTSFGNFTDIDGDGKNDLIVGEQMGRYWAVYGR